MTESFVSEAKKGLGGVRRCILAACALAVVAAAGCRQKMAEQPYYRPYEPSEMFKDGRSARPLERGVLHRAQHIDSDPMVTGLTLEEWGRIYSRQANPPPMNLARPTPDVDRDVALTLPRYDPRLPNDPKVYVEEYPFPITEDDLLRGQDRYTIYCAVCHGSLGNGLGKIWERGYLNPTSFHTEVVSSNPAEGKVRDKNAPLTRLGYSRGYALWEIQIPLREVPVGYIYEVITKGYGGMPSYSAQIPPADRWRITAYVRALQYSQHAPAGGKK